MTDLSEVKVINVAVIQAAPVLFDRDATLEKTGQLVAEAGKRGAKLVLLPEAFIPAFRGPAAKSHAKAQTPRIGRNKGFRQQYQFGTSFSSLGNQLAGLFQGGVTVK